ncbi:MAG: hypothetical protein GOV00_03745 [Candidatus Altiarchaeota archaeon]|nr:hypothetical protein [Candidatus Altiarchaeota archaeon]
MSPDLWRRNFFAFMIRLLGITLMIEGLGIFIMSGFEPLFMLMAVFLFLSGQGGFMLPGTVSWHMVFDTYENNKNRKNIQRKFVEERLEKVIPRARKRAKRSKKTGRK